uniref:Uncharacterized protein n=1 Tax=Peronospora matthiolae TaxID=2874970 RepID=A0AAV1U2I0_9STRA
MVSRQPEYHNEVHASFHQLCTRTKDRGRTLSFLSSSRRKKEEQEQRELELELETAKEEQDVYSKDEQEIVRPHAPTWDSDSDDDYENTKRPMRGLDRRAFDYREFKNDAIVWFEQIRNLRKIPHLKVGSHQSVAFQLP